MIERERRGNVEVVRLAHGKASALDLELSRALSETLKELEREAVPIVITGTGSIFSAGVDLFRILNDGADYVSEFLDALSDAVQTLFFLECPVVAAVNGHAVAGGCILVQACDYRVMTSSRGTIGVPELRVGVPFPFIALEIVRYAIRPESLQKVIYTGETFSPDRALDLGMLDETVDDSDVLDRAVAVAESFHEIPGATFRATKSHLRSMVRERFESFGSQQDQKVRELWNSAELHAIIRGYLEKTIGKKH